MKLLKSVSKSIRLFLAVFAVLLSALASPALVTVYAADTQTAVLSFDYSLISQIGTQARNSSSCSCFALAYARTILDGVVADWSSYNEYGNNQYNVCCNWSNGNYSRGSSTTEDEVYRLAYDSINNGQPFIVYVDTPRGHWVTVVGYQNVNSTNELSIDNFLILDSANSSSLSNAAVLSAKYSNLKVNDGKYLYVKPSNSDSVNVNITGTNDTPLGNSLSKNSGYCLYQPQTGVITSHSAPVWANAKKNSVKLDTFTKGTTISILGVTKNKYGNCFYEVNINGQTGYIYWKNVYYY